MPGAGGAPLDSIAGELASRIEGIGAPPADLIDWTSAADACEREARARGPGREAAQLFHQAGRILEERLGVPQEAMARYEEAALADPAHLPSLQAARRLAAQWGYAARECRFLEAEAAATPDPRRSAELDYARARLLGGALGRQDEARAALAAALAKDPGAPALHAEQARLAAASGQVEELLAGWLRAAEATGDDGMAAQLLAGAAALAEDRLGRPEEAAELAFRAFERRPADHAARALAWRHAERLGRDETLAAVLEAEGRAASTPRAAALALLQRARVEERLGRPERAREALAEARLRAPDDLAVLGALARSAERREAWEELADALQARLALEGELEEPPGFVATRFRLAGVLEQLGRPAEAAEAYRAALAREPGNRPALAALGRLLARSGNWEGVLETFLRERDASSDPRERAQRCFKAGELLEERMGRLEDASSLYAEALALDRALLAAARARERVLDRLGRHAELAELLEQEVNATEASRRVPLLFRLARLREDRLGDLAGAALCYRRALEIEPDHLLALRSLVVVLERMGPSADLAQALERAAGATADPRDAVALFTRAGEVREELGEEPGAAAAWERALAVDPTHLPALRALGRLCARVGRWEELVDMCRAEAAALPSPAAAAALLVRVGDVLAEKLDRADEAVAAWNEALTLAPGDPTALRALARHHRARGEAGPLAEVLIAEAAPRSLAERSALLHEVAEIQERQMGDGAAAARTLEEAIRADPTSTPAHRALQRLLASQGRWAELGVVSRLEAERAPDAERTGALWRLALLSADRLGDEAAAEAACREALARDPGHAGAAMLLERLGLPAGPEVRATMAERATDPGAARSLWVAAALDRRLAGGDPSAELARAVAIDPDDPVAGPSVEMQHRAAGRFADLAVLWEMRENATAESWSRAELALRAGEAWEDAGEWERALAACERARDLAPGSLPAIQALRRLRARREDWAGVRECLRQEAAASRDAGAAAAALSQAAEVGLSRLQDREGAVVDLREALAREPLDRRLAERLASLLHDAEQPSDLCALRESRARAAAAPALAAEEWLAAARIAAEQLGDRPRALAALADALAARPTWAPALLLRAQVLAAEGRPGDAVRDLTACVTQGIEPAAAVPVHLELAALYQARLSEPARALSHLNAVLAAVPDNAEALARLARVHRDAENWPAAADALRRLTQSTALGERERAERLLELAAVKAEGFGDPAAAAELCERALELVPGHPRALETLVAMQERAGGGAGLVSALERSAAERSEPGARSSALRRAAQIRAGSLGDTGGAVAALRQALELAPDDLATREELAALLAEPAPAAAAEEYRTILGADAGRVETWRALYRLFERCRWHDAAFAVAGVLRFLQASDAADDGAFLADNAPHAPAQTRQVLSGEDWTALRHPLDRGPLSELLALVGEPLAALLEEAPERGTRVRAGHPVRRLLEELAGNLGVEGLQVVEEGEGSRLALDAAPPGRIRVGAEFSRRFSVPEQRFLLARCAARAKAGTALADHLGPTRLGEFLASAVRQVDPAWSGTGEPGDGLVKQVARALPRRVRRPLEALAPRLQGARFDLHGWYVSLSHTGDRAGLLLAGDMPAALALLLRDGAPAPLRAEPDTGVAAAVRGRPDVQALLRFAASADHLRLRQVMRMAIA